MTNYEEKYKVLRNSINDFAVIHGEDSGAGSILEIAKMTDNLGTTETQPDMLTASKWNGMTYKERIALKESNPEQFTNSLAGTFKEEN